MAYATHLAIIFGIYAILALSLNLVIGYTGLVSVTQAAFYGIGAYATALLMINLKFSFFLAVPAAIILTMFASLLIGIVLSRFSGDYFVLGSIGFNTIIFTVMLNWQNLTGGPLGISAIPKPHFFGINFYDNFNFLILTAICVALVYFICRYIVNSSFGRVLKAIREDEKAISIFGYKTTYYKLAIFVIGAGLAALAGSLYASYVTFIDPSTFKLDESVFVLAIIILGGLANLNGSLLGALFLTLLPEALRFVGFPDEVAGQMRLVTYGLLLVFFMLYRPQGFIGEYKL